MTVENTSSSLWFKKRCILSIVSPELPKIPIYTPTDTDTIKETQRDTRNVTFFNTDTWFFLFVLSHEMNYLLIITPQVKNTRFYNAQNIVLIDNSWCARVCCNSDIYFLRRVSSSTLVGGETLYLKKNIKNFSERKTTLNP